MNNSGQCIRGILKRNPSVTNQDIIIVHDDLEHRLGNIRIKEQGSAQYIFIYVEAIME